MLTIDLRNGVPLYKQIVSGMKEKIISNELVEDTKVPSIRALATELLINPNTIKKAYDVLEQEGYIYSILGKGSYVKHLEDRQYRVQLQEIEDGLFAIVNKAKLNKINIDQLKIMLDLLYEESEI